MHFKIAEEDKTNHRYSGVLAHPTSFPSPYGIGDLGQGAYDFIDFLAGAASIFGRCCRWDRLPSETLRIRASPCLPDSRSLSVPNF